jgi:SAM-dependent methyltransferase
MKDQFRVDPRIRQMIKRTPMLGPALGRLRDYLLSLPQIQKLRFHSEDYWESRYARGGTSGAGSYGPLAEFKAETLNAFVQRHRVQSVVELGCGDGNQLSLLRCSKYTGLDVSARAINICEARFRGDLTKTFVRYHPGATDIDAVRSDVALSLDVIYHLIENRVFTRYMTDLFRAAARYVIIYSDNVDRPSDDLQVRHRKFSAWIDNNRTEWKLIEHIPNRYPYRPGTTEGEEGSWADFWIYENTTKLSMGRK